jgi:hypothetical protein
MSGRRRPVNGYREIGRIVRLQIQRQSLKRPLEPLPGTRRSPDQYYNPARTLAGDALWVTDSVAAIARDDDMILDVHCAAHPQTRNRGNGNMLSIGFTSHYDKMRAGFGDHLADGIAGENILVETGELFELDDLEAGIVIQTGNDGCIAFDKLIVAAPCVEFSRFCLGDHYADPKATSEALRFLDGGTRGFYAYISSDLPAMLRVGDVLLTRDMG